MEKRLLRSRTDRVIAGICAGLADYFGVDPLLIRLVFIGLAVVSLGIWVGAYLLLWFIMPEEMGPAPSIQGAEGAPDAEEPATKDPSAEVESIAGGPGEVTPATKPPRQQTRILGWILVAIGGYFVLRELGLSDIMRYIWPVLVIGVGVLLLWPQLRKR